MVCLADLYGAMNGAVSDISYMTESTYIDWQNALVQAIEAVSGFPHEFQFLAVRKSLAYPASIQRMLGRLASDTSFFHVGLARRL